MSYVDKETGEVLTHEEYMDRAVAAAVSKGYRRAYEIPDPDPMAPPLNFKRQPTIAEQMQAMVRSELLRREAEAAGMESFEESEDFEVGDNEPFSPFEMQEFDPVEALREARRREEAIRSEADRRDRVDNPAPPAPPPAPKARSSKKAAAKSADDVSQAGDAGAISSEDA